MAKREAGDFDEAAAEVRGGGGLAAHEPREAGDAAALPQRAVHHVGDERRPRVDVAGRAGQQDAQRAASFRVQTTVTALSGLEAREVVTIRRNDDAWTVIGYHFEAVDDSPY